MADSNMKRWMGLGLGVVAVAGLTLAATHASLAQVERSGRVASAQATPPPAAGVGFQGNRFAQAPPGGQPGQPGPFGPGGGGFQGGFPGGPQFQPGVQPPGGRGRPGAQPQPGVPGETATPNAR